MGPGNTGGNKSIEEQCCCDRPGMRLRGHVVEIGDRAVQPAVVWCPQRQSPQWIVLLPVHDATTTSAQASSLQNIAGRSGPSATRAAPVRVAQSTSSVGDSSHDSARRSHNTSRPSASVLPTSTVMPLRVRITSSGRIAVPEIEFSTQPTRTASRTGRSASIIMRASPRTVAAPPISFFIRSMPLDGLMS